MNDVFDELKSSPRDNRDLVVKLHIFNNIPDLQTDADLEKLAQIREAKKDFIKRDDILFYITGDDLIRIQQNKTRTYIRLCIEKPKKHTHRTSEYNSLNNIDRSLNITAISPQSSPQISPKRDPDTIKRPYRSNSDSNNHTSLQDNAQKILNMGGIIYQICYKRDNNTYSIFVVERDNNRLLCKGITAAQIDSTIMSQYKSVSIKLKSGVDIRVCAPDLVKLDFPLYVMIAIDIEYNYEQFINILDEIIKCARSIYLFQNS